MSIVPQFMDAAVARWSFYVELNKVINWESIVQSLSKVCPAKVRHHGQMAHYPLLLFKMLLVGQWHKLSDREPESYVGDTISARHCCVMTAKFVGKVPFSEF